MKQFMMIALMMCSVLTSYSQTKPNSKKVAKSPVCKIKITTPLYDTLSFVLSGIVKVKNGKDVEMDRTFTLTIKKSNWESYKKSRTVNDENAFIHICQNMTSWAKIYIKNPLSFEPLDGNSILYMEKTNTFICKYKLMGRNDYGNLIESEVYVRYTPTDSDFQDSMDLILKK